MLVSVWKSKQEIEKSLEGAKQVAVFSCNVCANLNGTGGIRGLKKMKALLQEMGKKILVAKTVNVCCSEEIMRQCMRIYIEPEKQGCDAVVMLSCAGGVKSAWMCTPGVPVVAALDSAGSGVVSTSVSTMEAGICTACGHCVLTYTHGICPVTGCPSKKKYGPCKAAPPSSGPCAVDPEKECIWRIIELKGDMEKLAMLSGLHQDKAYERISPAMAKGTPAPLRRFSAWFMARLFSLSKVIDLVK